jgi:hypothetical protein
MNKSCFIILLLIINNILSFSQELIINEVMTANASSVLDNSYYNYTEWIEIYNPSGQLKNIAGYYLSDDLNNLKKWKIPSNSITANGFKVFWFDKMNTGQHANFRLRSNREIILLSNAAGVIIDSVRVEFPYRNFSYGRTPDGSSTWAYFKQATPGTSNTSSPLYGQAPEPIFSLTGGRYTGTQTVSLSMPAEGYVIRYTTDGSEPKETSSQYSNPIKITKTTTLKARAFATGQVPGNTVANTYFINEHTFTIPVISVSLDPLFLNDNTIGIYVEGTNGVEGYCYGKANWNRNWERSGYFEYFKPDGQRIINTGAGIKIAGACSRTQPQKSFGVYFRDKYGADNIRYPLFLSKQIDRFTSIMLRNSGNDWNRTMFHDGMMQSLIMGQMDIDFNAFSPSAVYLNGQYWGILNTREKINEGYLHSNYGLDEDSIDFLERYMEIIAGSSADYNALLNFLNSNSLASSVNYQYVKDRIDIDEYINYLIVQIYSSNTDWPGNNLKYWKSKRPGSKWRWILFDLDFGFGLYGSSPDHNTLAFATETNGPDWPNPPWSTFLFRKLLENEEFRKQFIDRFTIHIYSTYNPARVNHIIDSIRQIFATEIPYHFNRWGGSVNDWENNINVARNFAALRPGYMMTHLQNFFSLSAPYSVKVTSNTKQPSFVSLNEVIINDTAFEGSYFGNRQIRINALSNKDYVFKQWKIRKSNSETIQLFSAGSEWKYLDDNSQPVASWKTVAYDDSGWKSGNGQLGYGDGDESTILDYGPDANNKYITYYFRKKFTLTDTTGISRLLINILLDDGAVVYLNGQEILRYNMPSGAITQSTLASSAIADETRYYDFTINNLKFNPGENVIAVELHQSSATSSDIGFDMYASAIRITGLSEETDPNPEIIKTVDSNLELIAEFETTSVIKKLFINEICAKNTIFPDEEFEYDDWIEIYNAGNEAVNLGGLYFTNNLKVPDSFIISDKAPSLTEIPPHSFKVLWADNEPEQGFLHLGFNLAKDGGQVGIAQLTEKGMFFIDSVTYPKLKDNYSYGRYTDATSRWFMLGRMTPGESNVYTDITDIEDFKMVLLYPNPARDYITINFTEPSRMDAEITIFSVTGQEMLRISIPEGTSTADYDITVLPKGIYLMNLKNTLSNITIKFIKE